jgi:hypothetical protein
LVAGGALLPPSSSAEWAERMDARREDLDFAAEFAAAGKPYVGLDAQG